MQEIKQIIYSEPRKTFMEIMKVHTSEVPFANLLAFFLRPEEKHGLGLCFIEALLDTPYYEISNISKNEITEFFNFRSNLGSQKIIPEGIKVKVEEPTAAGNRIDILIVAEEFAICIEFKINHDLDNPLEDYSNFVKNFYPDKKHFFLVLTPYKKVAVGAADNYLKKQNEFKQVLLGDFFQKVKNSLPEEFSEKEETKIYFEYFQELEQTLLNRKIRSQRNKMLHLLRSRLKIRIKSSGWHFEKWSLNNKFESKTEILGPETTFQEISLTLTDIFKSQAVIHSISKF